MKKGLIIFSLFILFNHRMYSQITVDEFNREKATLLIKKLNLQKDISELKSGIDSLNFLLPESEQLIIECFRELYILKYGDELGQRVAYSQIWKGMTESMMKDSWGEPDKIDKNVENWGVFTQWYYGEVIFFFRDGKLIDWEEGPEGKSNDSEFYLNKESKSCQL